MTLGFLHYIEDVVDNLFRNTAASNDIEKRFEDLSPEERALFERAAEAWRLRQKTQEVWKEKPRRRLRFGLRKST